MRPTGWVCLAGLLLGGTSTVRAGAVLVSGSASSTNSGSVITDVAPITILGQFYDPSSSSVGSPFPNSATATVTDSASPTPGGSISASGSTTLTLSPTANNFTLLTAPASASTSASVNNTVYTSSEVNNTTISGGEFTLAAPSAFTLTVTFNGQASSAAAPGSATGMNNTTYVEGNYNLYDNTNYTYYAQGYNQVLNPYAGATNVYSGYNYVTNTSGYTPTTVISGVLPAGDYSFFSRVISDSMAFGYSANAATSGSQSYTLTLSPAAAPEPASLTLLGLGAVSLAGYGWRRRKQAVNA
jgi:hypothetical protein